MLEYLLPALAQICTPTALLFILGGVVIGIVAGALPGLTPPIAIALTLPFTFGMDPTLALAALGGIYMAAEYSGSISAILLNTPGTAAAVCTAFDGYPLARQGRGQEALYLSIFASTVGGLFGVLVLFFFTPDLARLSLSFGNPEMFWIGVAGLSVVVCLAAKDLSRGMISVCLGLAIACVGEDSLTGEARFHFNSADMEAGIALVPALLGFFSISQMLSLLGERSSSIADVAPQKNVLWKTLRYIFVKPWLLLRSCLIGVLVGVLPGAGASVASLIAYSEAKRTSSQPEAFGSGAPEGIIAAESANNAMVGGSLVPLLAFGIPGSAAAAVLFGALTMNGLIAGPQLFIERPEVAYGFMVSFLPTLAFMLLIGAVGARWFAAILKAKTKYIIPAVLVLTIIGSYSVRNSLFDVWVTAACGLLGFFMLQLRFSMGPVVLGIILGPMIEFNLRRSLLIARSHDSILSYFFTRPISIVLMLITALLIILPLWRQHRERTK